MSSPEKEEKYTKMNFFAEFSEMGLIRAEYKKGFVNNWLSSSHLVTTQNCEVNKISNIGQNTPFEEPLHELVFANVKPNCCIVVCEKVFGCNLQLLQCYSQVFESVNPKAYKQLNVGDISMMAFHQVYEWMLSAKTTRIHRNDIMAMFDASQLLRIDELNTQCWHCLDDDLIVREEEAVRLYKESELYSGMGFLRELLLGRVSKYFLKFVASSDFLQLDVNEVCALLSSHSISVNTEVEVMMSAIRWLKHNQNERARHTEKLLECVRFPLLPTSFLLKLKDEKLCTVTNEIVRLPAVKLRITKCLKYFNRLRFCSMKHEESVDLILANRPMIVRERQWIIDAKCDYHHHLECKNRTILLYDQFIEYVQKVGVRAGDSWIENQFVTLTNGTILEKCPNGKCLHGPMIPYYNDNPEVFEKFGLHVLGETYNSFIAFHSKMDEIEAERKRKRQASPTKNDSRADVI